MSLWVLDTSALLTLRENEASADRVAELLKAAALGEQRCFGCFMSLMEVYYRVWKDEGAVAGKQAYQSCLTLPVEWVHDSSGLHGLPPPSLNEGTKTMSPLAVEHLFQTARWQKAPP